MSIIAVKRVGSKFAVTEDGNVVPNSHRDTRGEAVQAAIEYRKNG